MVTVEFFKRLKGLQSPLEIERSDDNKVRCRVCKEGAATCCCSEHCNAKFC